MQKVKPELKAITESVYASGSVRSIHQYEAYATVSGIIKEIYVEEGDKVKKGSPILYIGNDAQLLHKQNSALAVAFADISANRGKLDDAKLTIDLAATKLRNDSLLYSRQLFLWQNDIATKVELEQRELAYQSSRNAYEASVVAYQDLQRQVEFNAKQSRNNLAISSSLAEDYILRSEIDGVVYQLPKKIGELVGLQTPLALVGGADRFLVELQVDEYDIILIKVGLPVIVTMDSYKGQVFPAVVTKINPIMDERSKTFLVEAQFTKAPARLYPNMTLEANIVIRSKEKALIIPRSFMMSDSTVLKSNGTTVFVKTGLKDYQKIEIVSGIDSSDELKIPEP